MRLRANLSNFDFDVLYVFEKLMRTGVPKDVGVDDKVGGSSSGALEGASTANGAGGRVIALYKAAEGRPAVLAALAQREKEVVASLVPLTHFIFVSVGCFSDFEVPDAVGFKFIEQVARNYAPISANPYHHFAHAVDVLQTLSVFLKEVRLFVRTAAAVTCA